MITLLRSLEPGAADPWGYVSLVVSGFAELLSGARETFHSLSFGFTDDAAALVFGITDGFDTGLNQATQLEMRRAGLSHLTAVSGMNCVIVLTVAKHLIARLPVRKSVQILFLVISLLGYLSLVGPEPSILRAAAMALVAILASYSGRNPVRTVPLSFAVFVLLLLEPELAFSAGFLLSVLATFGLLVMAPVISEHLSKKMLPGLATAVSVSLAAQICTLPVVVYLQGEISLTALLANLIVETLVFPITILGLVGFALSLFSVQLAPIPLSIAAICCELILAIAELFGSTNVPRLDVGKGLSTVLLVTLFSVAVFLKVISGSQPILRFLASMLSGVALICVAAASGTGIAGAQKFDAGWQLISCDVGQGDATLVRLDGQILLIDTGNEFRKLSNCLSQAGVSEIQHLVLTHFDLDHVGATQELISATTIERVYLNNFKDGRWAATRLIDVLERSATNTVRVQAGDRLNAGSAIVTVLSPGKNYGEDSNDASTVILVEFADFNFLALADTGEQAQMELFKSTNLAAKLATKPLVVKVAHHGSSDQFFELYEDLSPELSLVSAGASNSYGHPTEKTMNALESSSQYVARTDLRGSITVRFLDGRLAVGSSR